MGDRTIGGYILSLGTLLCVIFNVRDRSYVVVASPERVVGHEEDEDAYPYHAAPIHLARHRAWSSREELEHPEHHEEAHRNDVNSVAGFSKVESRSWELFTAESLLEDAWDLWVSVLNLKANHNGNIHAMQIM